MRERKPWGGIKGPHSSPHLLHQKEREGIKKIGGPPFGEERNPPQTRGGPKREVS